MIPVWVLIFSGILGYRSLVECVLCTGGGGSTTSLSISYTAGGVFSVSVSDVDSLKYCVIQLTSWNSVDVSAQAIIKEAACSGIAPQTFDKTLPTPDLEDFEFGTVISFKLSLYDDSSKAALFCQSATYSITPALCRGGSYDLSVLNVLKRPYGTISASLSNKPLSGKCVYYLTEWKSIAASVTSIKTDCSGTSFAEAGFAFAHVYTVKMMSFASGATVGSDQPVCGVNAKTITPTESSATLAISDIAYGVVQVLMAGAAWGSKCEVSLISWAGVNWSSLGITKSSADCSTVSFSANDVGYDFEFAKAYSFEMAEYSNTVSNTAIVNPISGTEVESITIASDNCASTNIVPTRIDDYSVAVSITGGKSYAACRVTVTSYDGSTVSMVRVGLCSSYFRFTSDGTVLFAATKSVFFKYEFFPTGDVTGDSACGSSELTTWPTTPATDNRCTQAPKVDASQIGLYVFSIAEPTPMIGICKLLITSCTDSTQTNTEISFPSCSSSLALTYTDILASVTDLIPGRQCNFKWKYYNLASSNPCSYTGSAVSANIMIPVTVTQSSPSLTSIGVTVSAFPSALSTYLTSKTAECHAVTRSCSSAVGTTFTDTVSCTGATTISRTFTTDNNCVVEVLVYDSTNNVTALASSGTLSVAVAGIPVWGASQKPVITLYGDSCMAITWAAPSSTGGAPILCYEVQRKDASGTYYVIQDCTIGDTSTSTTSCGFTKGVAYQYQVIAINRNGRSADLGSVSISQKYEYLLSAPDSTYESPTSTQKNFVAGAFPAIIVQAYNPESGGAVIDSATSDRLFVSTVVSRCKLDSTATIKVDLTSLETDYTDAELPIPANSPPALTQVFDAVQGSAGQYRMVPQSQPLAGAYSVITYSLETGGLGGQYWSNPFLSGSPAFTRKDPVMDFVWGMEPLINSTTLRFYDLVGIRWTGFIEAAYSETYAIFVEANQDQVRVWIDDVVIINKWEPEALCNDVCVGYASLRQSSSTGGRKFSTIRAEFVHSKGPAQSKPAQFTLKWTSMSQVLEVIPPERLFKSVAIQLSAKTITLIPANIAAAKCTFELENESFNTDENYNIIVYAKDTYGNILQTSDSQFKATFTPFGGSATNFLSVPVDATVNNGTYAIAFRLTLSGDYGVTIKEVTSATTIFGGSFSISVSTGEAYSIASAALVGGTQYADVPVTFRFKVKDSSENEINGAGLTTMPSVHVSALWTGDTVTHARLGTFDDVSWRSSRYGILFTDATLTYSASYFRATMSLPRQGSYDVTIGVDNGGDTGTLSVDVVSDLTSLASYALVIPGSAEFPPTDLAVGVASSFTLQLRDQYMNAISGTPDPLPTVVLRLQNHPTTDNQVSCTAAATAGQYTCSITPEKSGSGLAFSILVGGVFASYAYDSSGTILYSRGPWSVDVSPGVVSGTHCVLSGVRTTYVTGVSADATLLLRDAYDNNLGAVSSWPDIVATFSDGASYSVVMDDATFEYDASAGIVTIPLVATEPDTAVTLTVTVDGDTVPLPYGITALGIRVIEGVVIASMSDCLAAITTPAIAGATVSSYCLTRDSQGNAISWSNLDTSLTFVHQTDSSLADIVALGTVNGGNAQRWDYTTTQLTKIGVYWYYILMSQPGGLVAQYYQTSNFGSLIGIGGTPLTIVLSGDVSPTEYTRIDQFIDLDLGGPILVDGVTALSARWIGRILSPYTGTISFSVACNGGVRVQVGASVIDYLGASSVDETFDVSALTSGTYYALQIDYKPSALASLSFKWTYTGAPIATTPFVVPPSYLHSSLNVATSLKTITINVAPVSLFSSATFSSGIVAGKADYIIVQATDQYGNDYSTTPSACVGTSPGTVPTCLFQVTMVLDDGSTIGAAVDLTNGKIKIPVTFATDGPKDVNVKLQVNSGSYSHIQGSPYSIVVNPNPR